MCIYKQIADVAFIPYAVKMMQINIEIFKKKSPLTFHVKC